MALRHIILALAALGLAACDMPGTAASLKPVARPGVPAPPPVVAKPTSQKSAFLRSRYASVQADQLANGLLRTDGGGADTPFTAEMLARNFEQIAFFDEYSGGFSGPGGASPLRRWSSPVRMEVIFGDAIPPSQRRKDADAITRYAARLSRVTGHPIRVGGKPNFIIIIAGEDDRADALKAAEQRVPGIARSSGVFEKLPQDIYCGVVAYANGDAENVYTAGLVVIRAENPDLLRLSCIHEELAQGLGLANDSPSARPSIFNDNDEFALLTRHDELLLRMLYDNRLRPGLRAAEARSTVRRIAQELAGGPV